MDRARVRVGNKLRLPCLAFCLWPFFGCLPDAGLPLTPATPNVAVSKDSSSGRKRDPKPVTCVTFGDFCSNTANEPGRTPQDRDERREKARLAYLQALKTDPHCVAAYAGLARLHEAMSDHERAVTTYEKALQVNPKEAGLWFELGMCQARHREWSAALQNLQRAQELDPDNRRYADMLGFCLARTGNYDASIACFKKVMSEAQAHYCLARMLHHNGILVACKEHLQIALRLQPDLVDAQQLLNEIDGLSASTASLPAAFPAGTSEFSFEDAAHDLGQVPR